MGNEKNGRQRKRSGVLLQVTIGVIIIFIISSTISWISYYRSVNNMVKASKEELITSQAELISSAFDYLTELFTVSLGESLDTPQEVSDFMSAMIEKRRTSAITAVNDTTKAMAESETMGINLFVAVILASPPSIPESTVLVGSDDDLIFSDVPKAIEEALESGGSYALLEQGVPEWGLEDEQLMVILNVGKEFYGGAVPVYALGFKPMHNEIARIDDFYAKQKRHVNTVISIVIPCSLVVLMLLTFFWLRFLIKSKITEPIEELEDAAEKVMEGNLDVEVPVREGEEFINLKKAFNGMVSSIRDILSKATGE